MTLIEVLDSAIKIGLGALIAALSTSSLSKAQHVREIEKERRRREREILEQVAQEVETFSHAALRYWAYMTEWMNYKRKEEEMPEDRIDELTKSRILLFNAFKDVTSAEARLLLLSKCDSQNALRLFGDVVKEMRGALHDKARACPEGETLGWRSMILEARTQFFSSLSRDYHRV